VNESTSSNKALFLDRDGVINIDHGYLYQPEKFEFIDGVFAACKQFQQAGYKIIVVTNQSGIGRGYYTEDDFHHLTKWMIEQFKQQDIEILDVYFCPHHPEKALDKYLKDCNCRKPKPGMLLKGLSEHQLDAEHCIMIGDKGSDMKAAIAAHFGQKYLVTSGQSLSDQDKNLADQTFSSLTDMAEFVLGNK